MEEKKYEILDRGCIIATGMDLDTALCLIKGYTERYFNEILDLTIRQVESA